MNDRDKLIDDILSEVAANRGVPYEKRMGGNGSAKESVVNAILAESATRPAKPENSPRPEILESADKKPEKQKKEKPVRTSKKNQETYEPLSEITPWDQRQVKRQGMTPEEVTAGQAPQPVTEMEGVKRSHSFLDALKGQKQPKPEETSQLLYKRGGVIHPPVEEPADRSAGQLEDLSETRLQEQVEQAAKERDDIYEPTRAVPPVGNKPVSVPDGKTTHFRPAVQPDEITGQVMLEGFDAPEAEPQPEKWEDDFITGREDKVREFVMETPAGEERESTREEDGDYHSVADAAPIKYDLLARRRSVTARLWITLVLMGLGLVFTLSDVVDLTNGLLSDNPTLLLGLYLAVLVAGVLVNFRVLWGGFLSLFAGGDQDSPAALGMAVSLVQGVVMLCVVGSLPGGFANGLMGCPALLCVVLNLLGKRLMFSRLYRNMDLIGNAREKYAVTQVNNKEEAFELGRGLAVGSPKVVFAQKAVDLKEFIYHSYAPDRAELSARLPALLSPLFGVLGGLLAYFFVTHNGGGEGVMWAVSGFAGGVMAALPVSVLVSGNFPFHRLCRRLYRQKVMLSGYDAVEQFADTDVVTLDASQLFPAGSIALKSIKSAANHSLDQSIMDVAGVVYMADSPLKPLFNNIIQGKTDLLPAVDTLVYEEEMGISGWVMGYRVLVGTRKLMENHGVLIPDTDYEEKYNEPGLKTVYLSTQGILSAIFLVKYSPDPKVADALQQAVAAGLSLHIYSCDPNVTREMICRMFRLPAASVRVMGPVPRRLYKQQLETRQPPKAVLAYLGNADGYCRGLVAAKKLNRAIAVGAVLQTLFVLIGALLFCVALYLLGGISGGLVFLYQLATTLLILGLPMLTGR